MVPLPCPACSSQVGQADRATSRGGKTRNEGRHCTQETPHGRTPLDHGGVAAEGYTVASYRAAFHTYAEACCVAAALRDQGHAARLIRFQDGTYGVIDARDLRPLP